MVYLQGLTLPSFFLFFPKGWQETADHWRWRQEPGFAAPTKSPAFTTDKNSYSTAALPSMNKICVGSFYLSSLKAMSNLESSPSPLY